MEPLIQGASSLGFPIAIAIFFVYQNKALNDKFIELATQASADSTASTKAIERATEVIDQNTAAFNRLSGVLEARK